MNLLQSLLTRLLPTQPRRPFREIYAPRAVVHVPEIGDVIDAIQEAENGDAQRLFALCRDCVLKDLDVQSALATRKLAVLGDRYTIAPQDDAVPADVDAARRIEDMLAGLDDLTGALNALMDAVVWPVAIVRKQFRPSSGGQRFTLVSLQRVNPQLFDFMEGHLRLANVAEGGMRDGSFHDAGAGEYIIHRGHLLTTPDNWGGPMRSLLFWWLLSASDVDWWGRFLERFGAPFPVGKYENDDGKDTLSAAFSLATRLGGLVVSRDTEVQLIQSAATTSGDAFSQFHELCRRQMAKLILGQTMTSEGQAQGIGGTQANVQEGVRQDIRQWDSFCLGETLRTKLFRQYLRINGWEGRAPIIAWGAVDEAEAEVSADLLRALPDAGLELTDAAIELLGQRLGMELRRAAPRDPAATGTHPFDTALGTFSAREATARLLSDSLDHIAASGRRDMARNLRLAFADIPRLLRDATSPQDFEARLALFMATTPVDPAPVERALLSAAANGSASIPTTRAS